MTNTKRLAFALHRFEAMILPGLKDTVFFDKDMFYGEPLPNQQFLRILNKAKRIANRSRTFFLDVGCGIGTKLLLAQANDTEVMGIEFNPEYVAVANGLGLGNKVFNGDAREFRNYHRYDIIYMFNPMMGEEEIKLEKLVQDRMMPGSVLILANGHGPEPEGWSMLHKEKLVKIYRKPIGIITNEANH